MCIRDSIKRIATAARLDLEKLFDGKVYLALVNLDPNRPAKVRATISGIAAKRATGETLTGRQLDAHNDFDGRINVKPKAVSASVSAGKVVIDLPSKSVTVVEIAE
mgnify:CR=1 FL=1